MPGHAIPKPFKWNPEFEVFYAQLDKEHQGLFDGIAAVDGAKGDAGKLKELIHLVEKHFRNEEKAMDTANYECKAHKDMHAGFEKELAGLPNPVQQKHTDFAMDWLVQHIKDTDFKYKGKLKLDK
uniref:Hemerythrin n=3 Tax=Polychaeta TaxID=6341 RepID=A0A1S6QCQ6_9ANNE|nr:hemerythrin [Drilonereis sp. EP-2017]AQV13630.1 hemerythrin [Eunice pennata]AQV13705.1 hemerythrin [Nicomache venticola]